MTDLRAGCETARLSVWCQALLMLCALAASPAGGAEGESVLEVPVRIPLAPVFSQIEQLVPREVRRDRVWEKHDGAEVRFAARRGALDLYARDNVLFLRTTVAYWLEARKRLLGAIPVTGSCGLGEPPRLAVITLAFHFGLRPDWRLDARPAVLPPAFLNPCLMTAVGIDVTGALAEGLQEGIWRAAAHELGRLVAESDGGSLFAAQMWSHLQMPLPLDDSTWLVLDPQAVWASQPVVDQPDLTLSVGLSARPRLVTGAAPADQAGPLPPLQLAPPRVPVVRFPVRLSVGYEDADALVRARLAGQSYSWAGNTVVIEDPRLSVDGSESLSVEVALAGDLSGRLRVWGTPAFDNESRELFLADIDYELETGDAEVRDLDRLFHDLAIGVIAERTRWPLDERLRSGLRQVEQAINEALPAPYRLVTSLTDVQLTKIRLSDTTIEVEAVLEGSADVALRHGSSDQTAENPPAGAPVFPETGQDSLSASPRAEVRTGR